MSVNEADFKAGIKFGLFWSKRYFDPDMYAIWYDMYKNNTDEFEDKLSEINHLLDNANYDLELAIKSRESKTKR